MIDPRLINSNILIADDEQANIDVLTGLLDAKGFLNYKTTIDSRQIFKLFDEFKPDILLLDLKMPYLTGFEVMTQLKVHIPANTFFPILVLTADITSESKQKALACGASDFLTKPFDLIEVDLRIKNLLKARYLHQQLENQKQILEEKVRERIKELEKSNMELKVAKEKTEHLDKQKSELLNQLSHEKDQKNQPERIIQLTQSDDQRTQYNGTILYVKDNLSDLHLVEQILETHRPKIRLITNMYGKNAVQFAIDYKPDLILVDLHLADMHGSEVVIMLQEEPTTAEIPIIILGENAMTLQIELLIKTGVKDYLIKPFDVAQFLKVVDEWVNVGNNQ